MKSQIIAGLCAVALTVASSAAGQSTATDNDRQLDTRIEQRIHDDASLKKFNIDVSVDRGVATLTGTVATTGDRAKASSLANITGITRIDNKIVVDAAAADTVKGTAGKVADKTKEGAEKVADKTKEGAEKVADKTKEGYEKSKEGAKKAGEKTKEGAEKTVEKSKEVLSKTGEVITDAWITTRVKSKFVGEDLLKDSNIDVDTKDKVVTLNGTVMSAAGRARAIAQAKEVEGVSRVVDNLKIGPK